MNAEDIAVCKTATADLPAALRPETYFDFAAHAFAHADLFAGPGGVCGAIARIRTYAETWIARRLAQSTPGATLWRNALPGGGMCTGRFTVRLEPGAVFEPDRVVGGAESGGTLLVERGAQAVGATVYLDAGDVVLGAETCVEPGAGLRGPLITGQRCAIRQGAYLRGGVVLGDDVTVRGEIKNAALMDRAAFPHPSYVGDSLCGYGSHFGNQATTANFGIFDGILDGKPRQTLRLVCDARVYDLGLRKMGVCLGDHCQVGCNSVLDPGTFLKPYTIAYALCRIPKGIYGPREVLKNKPLEQGVIARAPFI
jgi:UDP-N-acetylglucosamine diphosphorylase / glucose-1-phosphate thymidylyltransferase / UDP-N-acetylgalactosamine diphosphorylase / glucosamine-1-phosphate N-acetyltransferase / galactosamine-1-phosphate N-acetyltransferase